VPARSPDPTAPNDAVACDPFALVRSHNLMRKHYTDGQRAMAAEKLAGMKHGGDRRSEDFKDTTVTLKDADAAKQFDVSRKSVIDARRVRRNAIPAVVDAVERTGRGSDDCDEVVY